MDVLMMVLLGGRELHRGEYRRRPIEPAGYAFTREVPVGAPAGQPAPGGSWSSAGAETEFTPRGAGGGQEVGEQGRQDADLGGGEAQAAVDGAAGFGQGFLGGAEGGGPEGGAVVEVGDVDDEGQTRLRCMTDSSMPCIESICHNIYRWERGTVGLTERYKLYYCVAVGISPDEFGAGQDELAGALPGFPQERWRCLTW